MPVEENAATVGLTVQLPTAHADRVGADRADAGLDAHQKTTKLAKPIKTDDGDDHVRRLADHLDGGEGRRAAAGGVRRVHDHRRAAAGRVVADVQGAADLQRRHGGEVDPGRRAGREGRAGASRRRC